MLITIANHIFIIQEHRYYGASTPFPINNSTPSSAFRYLTTEQALADVSIFAWRFNMTSLPLANLTPGGTPWIFIGGSYSGIRAALMRNLYPETIHASWASSAPIQVNFHTHYKSLQTQCDGIFN
jgi:hypothetical protein